MKKIVKTLVIAAFAALALVSCQKEASIIELGDKFVMSIEATNPVPVSSETKTTMVGNEPKWQSGDKVSVLYKKSGNDDWFKVESSALAADAATASFTATLTGADTRTAYAYYPINNLAATSSSAKLVISSDQAPTGTAFDGNSDILVSEGFTPAASVSAKFARLGSILRFDLDNSNLKGEKLLNLCVEGENPLAGTVSVDLETATATAIESGSNSVTATYEAANQFAIGSDGNYAYMVVYPQTLAKDSDLLITGETEYYTFGKAATLAQNINLNPGHIVPITVTVDEDPILKVPFVDDMAWAVNGSDSGTAYTTSTINRHYSATANAYPGVDGIKMGTSSKNGEITTDKANLSSAFYIEVHAKKYGSDESQLEFYVDGTKKYTSGNLGTDYATYYYNSDAATGSSNVKVKITGKRGYINYIKIGSGEYVLPPVINVTSSNPMAVANTASSETISYSITNRPAGTAVTDVSKDVDWISNIDYSTAGSVTFDVAAQEPGAAARSGNITLSYTDASDVVVVVNQAAGSGGSTDYTYVFTSKSWAATLNDVTANWTSGGDGNGFTSGQGNQITTGKSGANATSPVPFTNVSKIVVTYNTNAKQGAGTIKVKVGSNTEKSNAVAYPGSGTGTSGNYTTTFNFSPKESGSVKLTTNVTTNSIWVKSITITAEGTE